MPGTAEEEKPQTGNSTTTHPPSAINTTVASQAVKDIISFFKKAN